MNLAHTNNLADDEGPLTVAQLTERIKGTLEGRFPSVWVTGEITDLARPRSGHVYLTLKDSAATIRAVIWRSTAARISFPLEDGQQVICRGALDVYPPRGAYQLIVRKIEQRGEGALQQRLRALQKRLAAEGLFDARHKQPLPRFPRRIGVITSPTGAAVRDFLEVVRRRWRGVQVLIIPARVQGELAAPEIARAIQLAGALQPPLDVLVVTRGGGSMEDLWCFNAEIVVRALFQCRIPVVSAVGHEIDVTLSDLVADQRALTPTEAAERVVPSAQDVAAVLDQVQQRLAMLLRSRLATARQRLDALASRRVLRRPFTPIHDLQRRLDDWSSRMQRAMQTRLRTARQRTEHAAGRLQSLSPLAVLERGYTITQRLDDPRPIRDAGTLETGTRVRTLYATGSTISQINRIDRDGEYNEDQTDRGCDGQEKKQ